MNVYGFDARMFLFRVVALCYSRSACTSRRIGTQYVTVGHSGTRLKEDVS